MSMSFEPGAPVAEGVIPLCVPEIRGNEWAYLKECLDTNFVSSVGPFVQRFEQEFASPLQARQALAQASGTTALHVALLVAGVEPDDEVLVSTLTFIASANAIRYVGAWPVFIDAEPIYWQMDPQKVGDFLQQECHWDHGAWHNRTTGRRVKAIMPVHILGHPVDMDAILETARSYGLVVIEDATESLGAQYKGRAVGRLGDIACFSFNGNKLITTGSGGMLVTDNAAWAAKAKYLTTQAKDDPVEYIHGEIGYNYRLTNIQAALGCAQLEKLDEYIACKRRIAARYSQALQDVPGVTPMRTASWASSVFWMYTILLEGKPVGEDSRSFLQQLELANIQTRPLWQPIHLSPAHRGSYATDCSVAEWLNQVALSLPCSVGLTEEDQNRVIHNVRVIAEAKQNLAMKA